MKKPLGIVLYEGASVLDGAPIVAIATLKTSNGKTGNMVQVWILRADMAPTEAKANILDGSVCGMCPHRHSLGGGCYVVLFHGPNKVYHSWKSGNYVPLDGYEHLLRGRRIRLGAYGDPAAVPFSVVDSISRLGDGVTGYTHQVHHPNFDKNILNHCMVSVDTESEARRMHAAGLRYFRVKSESMPILDNEIECPADENKGITCISCQMCNGANQSGKSIVIDSHGVMSKRFDARFGITIKNVE